MKHHYYQNSVGIYIFDYNYLNLSDRPPVHRVMFRFLFGGTSRYYLDRCPRCRRTAHDFRKLNSCPKCLWCRTLPVPLPVLEPA